MGLDLEALLHPSPQHKRLRAPERPPCSSLHRPNAPASPSGARESASAWATVQARTPDRQRRVAAGFGARCNDSCTSATTVAEVDQLQLLAQAGGGEGEVVEGQRALGDVDGD